MLCKNCGTKLEEDQKFCTKCGLKVGESLFVQNKDLKIDINEELVNKEDKNRAKLTSQIDPNNQNKSSKGSSSKNKSSENKKSLSSKSKVKANKFIFGIVIFSSSIVGLFFFVVFLARQGKIPQELLFGDQSDSSEIIQNKKDRSPCNSTRGDQISDECIQSLQKLFKENKVRWFRVFDWARKRSLKEVDEIPKAYEKGDEQSYERLIKSMLNKYLQR